MDEIGIVEFIKAWGSDKEVVEAARVSTGRDKKGEGEELSLRDEKLIWFLAREGHWSPFRHCGATMRVRCPITCARQIFKHRAGVEFNEESGRYIDRTGSGEPAYIPLVFREGSSSIKQGSLDTPVEDSFAISQRWRQLSEEIFGFYEEMLQRGVCKEQARMILPQSMFTSFYMSASLEAWAYYFKLRCASDAQQETRELSFTMREKLEELEIFKHSLEALRRYK